MPRFKSAIDLANEGRNLYKRAEDEGRELTPEERGQLEGLLELARERKSEEDMKAQILNLSNDLGRTGTPTSGNGPGDVFVKSSGYQRILDPATRGANWTTGGIEVPMESKGGVPMGSNAGAPMFNTGPFETKATLTTTPGTALTPAGYVPGVVETPFQPLYVGDLFPQHPAPGPIVRYVSESTATNAAAAVAEGAPKPESSLAFSEVSEPVRKIATFLPVSDEMLEDAPQIQTYLNSRLSLFVKIQEEAQLLTGSGTAPNLTGIVGTTRSIGTYARGTVDDNATAIFKAMNGTRGSSFLSPDTIVIHPTNWQAIRLAKDTSGQFYGGGPFLGSYGNAAQSSANQFTADSLWNTRVVVTSAMTVGTALVGNFSQGGAIYRKGGLVVEASNSHSTFFQTNLVALRAEERLALAIFRNSAFTAVVGLS